MKLIIIDFDTKDVIKEIMNPNFIPYDGDTFLIKGWPFDVIESVRYYGDSEIPIRVDLFVKKA